MATVEISPEWHVIGPFPAGMREQPFQSGTGDSDQGSLYTTNPPRSSRVPQKAVEKLATAHHKVTIEFPEVKWDQYRSTVEIRLDIPTRSTKHKE